MANKFDPGGITVPEVHLHRHRSRNRVVPGQWATGNSPVVEDLEFLLKAWIVGVAGIAVADSIVLAA